MEASAHATPAVRDVAPESVAWASVMLVSSVTVAGLAAASGGFFPESWGWSAVGLLWVASLGLLLRDELGVTNLQLVQVGTLGALSVWTFVSTVWSPSAAQPVLESERILVYLSAAIACVVAFRRGTGSAVAAGVWLAIAVTCLYSLGTRLLPDRLGLSNDPFAGGRLYAPIGYLELTRFG
jgi:hypothetical protein